MFVYSLVLHLRLQSNSLKEKRGIVKSILGRAANTFNVSAAEVGDNDIPGRSIIAFAAVNQNKRYARQIMERLENWLVEERPDVEIVSADIEER